jgi:hypothetical protein
MLMPGPWTRSVIHFAIGRRQEMTAGRDEQSVISQLQSAQIGDAVELYQITAVACPPPVVEQMRHAPFRPGLEAIAHTLAYDAAVVGDRSLPTG